jgi:chorismate dehydratase
MQTLKITAVSYMNTLPFLYGIRNSGILKDKIELQLDIPSICAQKVINKQVDIGLIPVAAIPEINDYKVFSDYCIGADGPVKTVVMLSDVPLHEIRRIYLDYQSKTSVNLVKVLAAEFWKISPKWVESFVGYEDTISGTTAGIIIGDRNFHLKKKYKFVYDFAEEWKKFCGMPFVFACWMSHNGIPEDFLNDFNQALSFGIQNIPAVVKEYNKLNPNSTIDLNEYYTKYISYSFDEQKKRGMEKFLEYLKK